MADDQRLPRQGIGIERGEKERCFGHVLGRSDLAVDGFLEHDLADDCRLRYTKRLRLLWDLLVDQRRAHETWADDVCPHAVLRTFLGDDFGKTNEAVFGGDIGCLE